MQHAGLPEKFSGPEVVIQLVPNGALYEELEIYICHWPS